jgi:glycosyltransferase involved in cell wall biosynthesis
MDQITSKLAQSTKAPAKPKPCVLVIGPNAAQIGGVATFLRILLSAEHLRERYELLHLDTSRGEAGRGLASTLAIVNLGYLIRQVVQFLQLCVSHKPQIVHLPINYSWAFWKEAVFIFLARLFGMKIVAHIHGGVFDQYYLSCSRFQKWLIAQILLQTDVVIALSNRWKDFLLENVHPHLNVEIVSNTVDHMFAKSMQSARTAVLEKVVLFVGELGNRKGVFDILKAIPLVVASDKDVRFWFAGKEESQQVGDDIEQTCTSEGINEYVKFLGAVTGSSKMKLFQKATVFLLPSYGENLPYALLEAMSSGLPVIVTPVGAIPELVQDGLNGFIIDPGNHIALADRIAQLLNDPGLCQRMGAANRSVIRELYVPEVAIHRFDQIYSKLVSAY